MRFFRYGLPALLLALFGSMLCAAPIPRPEHPFPQMQRSEWLNLNGAWEFAENDEASDSVYLSDKAYPDEIIVPYCRESKLSGLARKGFVKNVWYRKSFELPENWLSPRTILHIGACDWKTRVWLNGKLLGQHVGGSAGFSFEITDNLRPGKNTVIVTAYDDVRTGLQAGGKQSNLLESYLCAYTRTTGIWQTVWIEGVGSSYIKDVSIESDVANSRVILQAEVNGPSRGLDLVITAQDGDKVVGKCKVPANWRDTRAVLDLSAKRLWTVKDPFLYDLDISLVKGDKVIDSVASYFGLRSVSIEGTAILINGKPVFQRLVLDQGFYPEGIWTAPTDADLKHDIEMSQALGFNGARLHQKVFDPRYLYWADKLGYIVWGEFPNWFMNYAEPRVNLPVVNEWGEILRRDRNHPSIVGWCPFNESADSAAELQQTVVGLTRLIDPSRPVIESSGWVHSIADPDILDAHTYDQSPTSFRQQWCDSFLPDANIPDRYQAGQLNIGIPFMISEYGGTQWSQTGGWGYGVAPENLENFYKRYAGLTNALLDNPYMFGFCYTQITDVEQECNGLYYYDRKPKFDVKRIHDITSREAACEKGPILDAKKISVEWRVLVGAAVDKALAKEWRYTIDKPEYSWMRPDYIDTTWKAALGGFGNKTGWKTAWSSKDIWLRQSFEFDGATFDKARLVAHYDNATEVYVNGTLVWNGEGWNDRYASFNITDNLRNAIRTGRNVIAIHCHQDEGGQFIDAALLVGKL